MNPKDFALKVDAERTECALKMPVLNSENFNISLIHLANVAEEIGLCSFTKLRRSCEWSPFLRQGSENFK